MRTIAPPIWISARAPGSAHRRSPVVSGRFSVACTQSSSPAGEKLTAPDRYPRRATRDGGSALAQPLNARTVMPTTKARARWRREFVCMSLPDENVDRRAANSAAAKLRFHLDVAAVSDRMRELRWSAVLRLAELMPDATERCVHRLFDSA